MTDQIAIRTEGLTKHYGDVSALDDLDLDVVKGEVFGFLGPNGAGKTTMIRTILDEIRPTAGRASILGMDSHEQSVEIRRFIGYVPGDLALYPNLTGKDTLTYFANLRGGVDWSYVDALVHRLGADLSKKVSDLSSGNRQKIGLIQAFMNRPEVLIMDEPSSGLDPLVQREFQKMMREVASEGRSVFLSSHTLSEVQRVADRVGIIRHGRLIALESVTGLRSKAMRRVELEFDSPVEASFLGTLRGVKDVTVENHRAAFSYDGKMASLLTAVAERYDIVDIHTQEADLEEIFLTYYRDEEEVGGLMLATVLTKTLHDRWKGEVIAAASMAVLFLFGMAVYRDIDLAVYTDLPEVFRSLMNIPGDADVGALAYGAIYASYGAITLSALALAMGSASIAGEERDGTMGLLLSNPRSRTHVVVSKGANIILLTALGSALLWVGGVTVPALLDVDITGIHVGALVLHMFVIAVFHGFLALAISAWTGRSSLATGLTVAVMVLSFFAVGWLPLIEGVESGAEAFPWYYYSSSQPHLNGVDWGHLCVLMVGVALLAGAAVVGINRRDLRGQASGEGLIGRLRSHPLTQNVVERLAGSTRVSQIWTKTASENQGMLIVVASVMLLVMGVMLGPMYNFIDDTLVDLGDAFPEGLMEMFGGGDLSTPEGWYQVETFGLMAPIAFMLTVTIGARALAGEEAHRTMGLLLANPIRRSTVVVQKTLAMVVHSLVVAVALAVGVILGSAIGGLGMSWPNIVATTSLGALLGMVFGALALAISAATGRVRVSVFGTIGLALVFFVADGFLPLSDDLAGLARWTPMHYYLSSDPLVNGMNWGHGAVLVVLAAGLVWLAMVLFDRRDLLQSG